MRERKKVRDKSGTVGLITLIHFGAASQTNRDRRSHPDLIDDTTIPSGLIVDSSSSSTLADTMAIQTHIVKSFRSHSCMMGWSRLNAVSRSKAIRNLHPASSAAHS